MQIADSLRLQWDWQMSGDQFRIQDSTYPDNRRMFSLRDANHPKEFVDVFTWVANEPSEYGQDVVDPEFPHYLVGPILCRRHRHSDLMNELC